MEIKRLGTADLDRALSVALFSALIIFFSIRPQFQRARRRTKLIIINGVELHNFFPLFFCGRRCPIKVTVTFEVLKW